MYLGRDEHPSQGKEKADEEEEEEFEVEEHPFQ